MNNWGQIIQLLLSIQKFFLRRLQRPVTTRAERLREPPFLLDQEEENGGSALRVPKPQIKPRKYNNYQGDKTQL